MTAVGREQAKVARWNSAHPAAAVPVTYVHDDFTVTLTHMPIRFSPNDAETY
jgi:hypothetical protein